MPFFLHPKRFVRMVLTKVLSLLFTLTSAIFAQIRHLEERKKNRIFAYENNEVGDSKFDINKRIFTLSKDNIYHINSANPRAHPQFRFLGFAFYKTGK